MEKLNKEIVLVTGASSGVGLTTCRLLTEKGYKVYGTIRNKDLNMSDLFNQLYMDVTQDKSVIKGVKEIIKKENQINILVHCAGISVVGSIENTSIDEAYLQMNTNFMGALKTIKAVLPFMQKQKSGRIVVIGSMGGLIGIPFQGIYCASKFALEGLIEALRIEVEPFGIQATLIDPGDLNTSLTDKRYTAENSKINSVYQKRFKKAMEIYEKNERKGKPPIVVAKIIYKILQKRKIKIRYLVGNFSEKFGILLKRILPGVISEKVFKAMYKL